MPVLDDLKTGKVLRPSDVSLELSTPSGEVWVYII